MLSILALYLFLAHFLDNTVSFSNTACYYLKMENINKIHRNSLETLKSISLNISQISSHIL